MVAYLISMFTKEEERYYAIRWATADEKHIGRVIATYRNFLALILNASTNEYRIDEINSPYLNRELERLEKGNKEDIFRLVIEVEKRTDMYSSWQNRGVIYDLAPLNEEKRVLQYTLASDRCGIRVNRSETGKGGLIQVLQII